MRFTEPEQTGKDGLVIRLVPRCRPSPQRDESLIRPDGRPRIHADSMACAVSSFKAALSAILRDNRCRIVLFSKDAGTAETGHERNRDVTMQELPETGFLRLPQVLSVIPLGKTCWWEGVKSGRFPKPVKLSARCTAWRAEDIRELIKTLSEQTQVH